MTDWQTPTWLHPPPRSPVEHTHFLALPAPQEFSVQVRVRVRGQEQALDDRAGLMLRAKKLSVSCRSALCSRTGSAIEARRELFDLKRTRRGDAVSGYPCSARRFCRDVQRI